VGVRRATQAVRARVVLSGVRRHRIYDNPIGDEGMKTLAEALMKSGKYIKQLQ